MPELKGTRPDWFPDWAGHYVAIIGGGASVKRSEVDLLKDRLHTVVINESYQLAPWADVLYSCDHKWWQLRQRGWREFKGMKVTQDSVATQLFPELKKIRLRPEHGGYVKHLLLDEWGEVGSGQGSGFQVVNWLAQIAVKGMALLGFDACCVDKIHWHGSHTEGLNNPNHSTFLGWKQWMENAAPKFRELNIDMINCSMVSTIGCFPRLTVEDTLKRWAL